MYNRAWIWTCIILTAIAGIGTSSGCGRGEAKIEHDLTTPRSAAIVFTRAVEAGDIETAKTAAFGGGIEVDWVEAMAQAMSGMRKLVAAAEKKFGPEAGNLVAGKQTLRMSSGMATAEVQLNGDRATVIPTADNMKIPMKQVDGSWKLDVGVLTGGQDLTQLVKQLRAVGVVAPRMTTDVEAGKYRTVKEIQRALTLAVVQEMYQTEQGGLPGTNPSPPAAAATPAAP